MLDAKFWGYAVTVGLLFCFSSSVVSINVCHKRIFSYFSSSGPIHHRCGEPPFVRGSEDIQYIKKIFTKVFKRRFKFLYEKRKVCIRKGRLKSIVC